MTATTKSLLTPRELADAIGVSESSVKRWGDEGRIAVSRTAGGHRRIALPEAVRFIRATGAQVVRPEVLGFPELADLSDDQRYARSADRTDLFLPLLAGEAAKARAMVVGLFLAGVPLAEIFDGPIADAMRRVGQMWQHDEKGIFLEHRATDIVLGAMARLRSLIEPPGDPALHAVGGAPSGDPYLVPSQMAATLLTDLGVAATNLGPELPLESLAGAADHFDADLAWLSLSLSDPPRRLADDLRALADRLARRDTLLLVGGRGVEALPLKSHANIQALPAMGELAAFVRGLSASR